jgi:hypothetical protein
MHDVLRRIEENDQTNEPGVHSTGKSNGTDPVRGQWSEADLIELVASFRAGTTIRVLAEQYEMCESSVKRVLRRHGASGRDRRPGTGSRYPSAS